MPVLPLTTSATPTLPHARTRRNPPIPFSTSTLHDYASLASKFALAGRLREFLVLAEKAVVPSPAHFVSHLDTYLIARGVRGVISRGNNLHLVLDFLAGAEALGIRASILLDYFCLKAIEVECRKLLQDGKIDEFVDVMETLAGYRIRIKNIIDPMDILRIFVKKRDPNMAVRYASLHAHSQLLFCSIIEEFGKERDLASAIKAYEIVKNKSGGLNMFACRCIIDTCGICGDALKSRDIFEDLLSQRITPMTFVFNSLMNVNAYDLSYTLYVYKHMHTLGVVADVTSYNILLKACCLAKRVDLVQHIYKDLKHMKSSRTFQLDVFTYSTMIKAYSNARLFQKALEVKEDMIAAGVQPNVVTWSALIYACASAGFVDQAIQIFEEMLLSGCEPNTQCCNNLLNACADSCQYERTFRLFNTWKNSGIQVYKGYNDQVIGHKDFQGKLASANLPTLVGDSDSCKHGHIIAVPFKPTVSTYNILMKACGSDYFRAKHLIEEMKSMGLFPDRISWSTLINICGSTQNVKGAMQALTAMEVGGVRPDVVAFTSAIKACVGSKQMDIAFSLFEEMKLRNLQPNLVTYNTLLRARTKYGSLDEIRQCLSIYQDMRKAGFDPNDYYLKELLEEWCEGVLSSGREKQDSSRLHRSPQEIVINDSQYILQMVAGHLQKDIGEKAVDVRGLSKVEARIVVLSMLRMIKENYLLGHAVEDDLIIITGKGKRNTRSSCDEVVVQRSIGSLLKNDLGLDVLLGNRSAPTESGSAIEAPDHVSSDPSTLSKPDILENVLARRPEDFGIYRVPNMSLLNWLRKKTY